MMDARRLTKRQGGDPDAWADVKDRLPLLRQKKYYSQTRYGYARGDEARNYVENIRRYYQSIIGHIDKQIAVEADKEISTEDLIVIPALPPVSGAVASEQGAVSSASDSTSAQKTGHSGR